MTNTPTKFRQIPFRAHLAVAEELRPQASDTGAVLHPRRNALGDENTKIAL